MIELLPWLREPLASLLARRDKLPHALLVYGRQGIGKVEFARALAQSLLCETPEDGIACGQCGACGWFREGNHPDYRALLPENLAEDDDAEAVDDTTTAEKKKSKEIKIDQVRDLGDFMSLSTHRDGFRVLVIHPAEAMNLAAANALLKTLEEPPPRTAIVLVTDQLGRLLPTIRSRCQRVRLPAPAPAVALQWLTAQNIDNPEEALAMASGAPMDALKFAEGSYRSERKSFISALTDPAGDFVATAQSFEKGDLLNIVTWLQTWVADIVLAKTAGDVRHHVDAKKAIHAIAARAELTPLFRYEAALRQARRTIAHPLNARLLLEQLLISYQEAVRSTPVGR
jgi:DNA polymerase III subunit delta'